MEVDDPCRRPRLAAVRAFAGLVAVTGVVAVTSVITGPGLITAAAASTGGASTDGATSQETTPDPSPTAPSPIPAPTMVQPPARSPFDGLVGGNELGLIGEPIVSSDAPPLPQVDGFAWLVADVDSGDIVAAFSPHEPRAPASTIKLLTAITAWPRLDPEDSYTADTAPESVEGSRAGIVADGTYTIDDLIHGLMLPSGNDAAFALGELLGGQDETLALMNETARTLGAFDTNAASPHGLDTPGQVSSAYDLALIGRAALADDDIATIARTPAYEFPGRDGETFQIQNQNRLLDSYEGAIGLKTGYTTQAGHTLVGVAERDGHRLIATVLAADGRAEDSATVLFDWAFGALAAGDVEPVGRLVTPDEVERAVASGNDADAEDDNVSSGGADGSVTGAGDEAGRPIVMWGVAAVVVVGLMIMLRRRRGRSAGRYAADRR